jgi:hypothetical protein
MARGQQILGTFCQESGLSGTNVGRVGANGESRCTGGGEDRAN